MIRWLTDRLADIVYALHQRAIVNKTVAVGTVTIQHDEDTA